MCLVLANTHREAASNRKWYQSIHLYRHWAYTFHICYHPLIFQVLTQITLEQFKEVRVCKSGQVGRWGRVTPQRYTSVVLVACCPGLSFPFDRTMIKEQRPNGRSGLNDNCHHVPLLGAAAPKDMYSDKGMGLMAW